MCKTYCVTVVEHPKNATKQEILSTVLVQEVPVNETNLRTYLKNLARVSFHGCQKYQYVQSLLRFRISKNIVAISPSHCDPTLYFSVIVTSDSYFGHRPNCQLLTCLSAFATTQQGTKLRVHRRTHMEISTQRQPPLD